ncbi:MAG: aspartate--tRNA ligase [Nanoarchaeota archaeon]
MLRTHKTNDLSEKLEGQKVTLTGWIDTIREHGNVMFIDLRDRYGKVQSVITKKSPDFENAKSATTESCISITGEIKSRPKGTENKDLGESGKIEIKIENFKIFSKSNLLPFNLSDEDVNEETRMKYRYLDLRRPKMLKNMVLRHKIIKFIRDYLDKQDFLEINTPILTKSTPEGARDFIVPSRNSPGKFYALPQAPQQYKQLLMVGGMDKYFQIAPCFRDEDARIDRSPGEFYQIDIEMSFVEQEDILNLTEKMMIEIVKRFFPKKTITKIPFPRIPYEEAIKKYKTDSPDIRNNKEDKNELGFCWIIDFPLFEKQSEEDFFHGAGKELAPSHHMFTSPKPEDIPLLDTAPEKAKSLQHDLVLNGFEVGGGSVRISNSEIQEKIFDLIGFTKKQKQEFSHLLKAFSYGVPPHGGIAPGLDRLLMVLCGEKHLREMIAFPKNREAKDLVVGAPSEISQQQLKDVHIKTDIPEKTKNQKTKSKTSKKK